MENSNLHNWVFTYNQYNEHWWAARREHYHELWSGGTHTYKSKDLEMLKQMILLLEYPDPPCTYALGVDANGVVNFPDREFDGNGTITFQR